MTRDRRRAVALLATIAVLAGIAGMIVAIGSPFLADRGRQVGKLFATNTAGALLTIAGGVAAAIAAALRARPLALVAGLLFLAMSGLTLIGVGQAWNVFGGRGNTASLWLMLGAGLAALVLSPPVPEPEGDSGG